VTQLRKLMLEEIQRRNFTESTMRAYLRIIEDFARHFHRPPDQLGQPYTQRVWIVYSKPTGNHEGNSSLDEFTFRFDRRTSRHRRQVVFMAGSLGRGLRPDGNARPRPASSQTKILGYGSKVKSNSKTKQRRK
jgi:hypothetical protein